MATKGLPAGAKLNKPIDRQEKSPGLLT